MTCLMAATACALGAGCMSPAMNDSHTGSASTMTRSALSVTPVTNPKQQIMWSQFQANLKSYPLLRSVETYAFVAPGESEEGIDQATALAEAPPGTVFAEPAGAASTNGRRYFLHTPGQR